MWIPSIPSNIDYISKMKASLPVTNLNLEFNRILIDSVFNQMGLDSPLN